MTAREELIADLRAFADLLERRPDMPVGKYPMMKLQHSPSGDEADRFAAVRGVAVILGVDPVEVDGTITARLDLGCIEYVAYTSSDYARAAFEAGRSYALVVQPESVGAR